MTDYQLLFLCMTVMALFFMFFANYYYEKYHDLRRQMNGFTFSYIAEQERLHKLKRYNDIKRAGDVIDV